MQLKLSGESRSETREEESRPHSPGLWFAGCGWVLQGSPARTQKGRRAGAPGLDAAGARALVPASGSQVPGHFIFALHFPTFQNFGNTCVLFLIFSYNDKEKPPPLYQAPHMKELRGFHFACHG